MVFRAEHQGLHSIAGVAANDLHLWFTLMLSSCGLAIGIISYQGTSFEYIVVFKLENFYVQ